MLAIAAPRTLAACNIDDGSAPLQWKTMLFVERQSAFAKASQQAAI